MPSTKQLLVRDEFAKFLTNDQRGNQEPDSGHSHVISVLRKVRDHLQPHMEVATPTVKSSTTTRMKANNGVIKNMFGALQIYDTSSEFQKAPDMIPSRSVEIEYVAEEGNDYLDAMFAFTALLDDFTSLREDVLLLWKEYQAGKRDLAAVSVAINLAVEIGHAMEDDIKSLLAIIGGSPMKLAEVYMMLLASLQNINMKQKQDPKHPYNLDAYDLGNICLVNAMTMLISFNPVLQGGPTVLVYNGSLGWYDDKLSGNAMTNIGKWEQDKSAGMELLADLGYLGYKLGSGSIVDELTRGMATMIDNPSGDIPLWFGLALQIYLDILQFDGPLCNAAFDEFQQETLRAKKSMLAVPRGSPERARVFQVIDMWDTDHLRTSRETLMNLGATPRADLGVEFKFLRRYPVFCGLLVHQLRCTIHTSGATYLAVPGTLVGIVQLYHMMQKKQLIRDSDTWQDLETIRQLQGDVSFFVGNPPATYQDAFTNYCMAIGTSVRNWASDRKRKSGKVQIKSDNRRNLKFMGYLSLLMCHRLAHPGERAPWSSATIEHEINRGIKERYTDSRQHFIASFQDVVDEFRFKTAQMSPGELLFQVATDLEFEKSGLCFSLFTMHNQAWKFLQLLQRKFIELVGPVWSGEESLPYVCGMTLSFAAGRDLEASKKFESTDGLVRVAATVLQEFLAKGEGNVVMQEMENKETLRRADYPEASPDDAWGVKTLASAVSGIY